MREKGDSKIPPILAQLFSRQLRRRREGADLSQAQLAARAGYAPGYVFLLEKGDRVPTLETIEHFARALGVRDPRLMFRR
jgi:transcriptional regulator with XRE-family HTH domain